MAADTAATFSELEGIFEHILGLVITLGGIALFIMLIVGGFKYLTSGGDPKKTASASSTITMAVVGLLVAIGSWFILQFIADFTGIDLETLTNFSLTGN
ncbi:MAG: hypothetical protein U9Q63_00360 [Patescibacteria group bacterium]|nr:hypothetical protein [Patescibacteria group bacterium]